MFDDLQRAALGFRREHGAEALREVLAPYVRPGRRVDLALVVDRRAALIALALATAETDTCRGTNGAGTGTLVDFVDKVDEC